MTWVLGAGDLKGCGGGRGTEGSLDDVGTGVGAGVGLSGGRDVSLLGLIYMESLDGFVLPHSLAIQIDRG